MKNLKIERFLYILVFFSGFIWFLCAISNNFNMQNFIDFMKPIPTVVTGDAFLVTIFMKWGWRWKSLQGWLVPFPDLNGTWEGSLQTYWKDAGGITPGPIPIILTIRQSFLHISCVLRTSEMTSYSYVEGFSIDQERQLQQLCYTYTSKPHIALRDRSSPHDGTANLNIINSPTKKLVGEYWTQRQTTGSITLSYMTGELLEEFPAIMPPHPMTGR